MSTIVFKLQEIPHAEDEQIVGYFPKLARHLRITSDQLCQMIQERCTVTEADVKGVMSALAQVMTQNLAEGVRVDVPDLGSFSPSIVTDKPITDAADKQIARHLRVDNVNFQPKASLIKAIGQVTFRRDERLVDRSPSHTDEEVVARIRKYCVDHVGDVVDRATFQSLTGYGRTKACKVLSALVEKGLLIKKGRDNAPYYVLADE